MKIEKIAPDSSVIIEGRITELIESKSLEPKLLLIHEALISELEKATNEERYAGYLGLEEIRKLKELLKDKVKVTGTSKGKGFQGVVRRHHFKGGPASHGHKDNLRMPGSIGATFPQHVMKGLRMAGHMGSEKVSVRNLEIIEVDQKENLLAIKGAVPGARNSLLMIQTL